MNPSRGRSRRLAEALLLVLSFVLGACSAGTDSTDPAGSSASEDAHEALTVVVTTSVLGDVVRNVVGDAATVEVLLPIGADPHDYQPSSHQVALVNQADLIVANGLLLEQGLVDTLEAAAADGANVFEVAPRLDPIPFGVASRDDRGAGHDPHVWTDPVRMAEAARLIAGELVALDDSVDWADNAERFAQQLEEADEEIAAILAVVPAGSRVLVTNHDALGYFADRYGFEVVATVIPGGAALAEPSSAELAELVQIIRDEGVRVIFAETVEPRTLAEAVAAEVGEGVEVVELYTDSLGEPGSGADTLIGMLVTDAQRIAAAMT